MKLKNKTILILKQYCMWSIQNLTNHMHAICYGHLLWPFAMASLLSQVYLYCRRLQALVLSKCLICNYACCQGLLTIICLHKEAAVLIGYK